MKIGEIYCMNLFDFLENWHPNTLIIVEAEDYIIFEGTVKDIPLETSCKYWVQEGTVRKDGEKVVIPVKYEAEINRRIEEQNSISFSDILSNILSIIDSNDYLKEAFESMELKGRIREALIKMILGFDIEDMDLEPEE